MRWTFLDLITDLKRGEHCVGIRNVSSAEELLTDHFDNDDQAGRHPMPLMPNTLVIEGSAQCGGILVGHARDFKEKVLLAKIGKATFTGLAAGPGTTLRHTALLDRIDDSGAAITSTVELLDPQTGNAQPYAHIELMFSHIDQNRKGLAFPDHNFVFTDDFMNLLERSGYPVDPSIDPRKQFAR
ncbi:MAG: hypothetical protein V3V20_08670 [Algisphaera sp.]